MRPGTLLLASQPCQALSVGEVGALSDFDNVAVGIADVAADFAVFGDRRSDKFGSSAFPQFIARLNIRNAEIQACYELWKSRGAEFITKPIPKYGETRCYIRDPDGYIIEVGQSTDLKYG